MEPRLKTVGFAPKIEILIEFIMGVVKGTLRLEKLLRSVVIGILSG